MRDYELAFIIEPNTDDEGVTGVVDKVSQFVQAIDGAVTSVDVWGRRKGNWPTPSIIIAKGRTYYFRQICHLCLLPN